MFVVHNSFGAWDYVVFSAMLTVSLAIGVWFAVRGGGQRTQGEYLMGSRRLPVLPVALSILVSFTSAILILGTPAEMYMQGTEFTVSLIGLCIGVIGASSLFVPLLYPLKLTSVFEYLELRFRSRVVRLVGTWNFIISQIIYIGIASFAPAIAFQVVAGIPAWTTILATGVLATVYTTIGGIKAVIWTDAFQSLVILAGILTIVIQGTVKVGSLSKVLDINYQWERISFFNFDPDPRVRHTFWNLVIGQSFVWSISCGVTQASAQRYCSLPTLRNAKMSLYIHMIGIIVLFSLTCLTGVVLFAYYAAQNCNPLGQELVSSPNQLVPYFVMETLGYPGVPGLFIACLFSASLSSISSSLNSLGTTTWEDVLKPRYDTRLTETKKTLVTKCSVFAYGILSIGVSLTADCLEGTILQLSAALSGATGGPLAGVFILGAFFPWANSYGAVSGVLVGLGLCSWMTLGSYIKGLRLPPKPFPSGTCPKSTNIINGTTLSTLEGLTNVSRLPMTAALPTLKGSTSAGNMTSNLYTFASSSSGLDGLYAVSYMWYPVVGVLSCVLVGLLVSFITGGNSLSDVPARYQIHVASKLCCRLPRNWKQWLSCRKEFQKVEVTYSDREDTVTVMETCPVTNGNDLTPTVDHSCDLDLVRSCDLDLVKSSNDFSNYSPKRIDGHGASKSSIKNISDLEPMLAPRLEPAADGANVA